MSHGARTAALAAPWIWLGMVLAISFIEAPLKFRAPGITLGLGLGIGRLVFRALGVAEVALAAALCTTMLIARPAGTAWILLAALITLLAVQLLGLRPRLDRRAVAIIQGHTPEPSRQHLTYIGLEATKVVLLIALALKLTATALS
jgi:hypothetical protein